MESGKAEVGSKFGAFLELEAMIQTILFINMDISEKIRNFMETKVIEIRRH
jgi:hypothetical protein